MNRHRSTRWSLGLLLAAALVVAAGSVAWATEVEMPRLLVVDATKTFASTLRVGGLVGALRASGAMAVEVVLTDAASVLDDPLPGSPEETEAFDLMIILPRGLDDGTAIRIWLLSESPGRLAPSVVAAYHAASQTIDLVFAGVARAVDVTEDLYPALLWAGYRARGWMR
ncbi:MAG: hypothetical protein JSW65_00685 [Candidatus Bipolaricaulota bacterium]|nr:MAG: hypothetical protein JSW65_00685 [Candidatus Bipolaricaulota bacterium]